MGILNRAVSTLIIMLLVGVQIIWLIPGFVIGFVACIFVWIITGERNLTHDTMWYIATGPMILVDEVADRMFAR